MSTPLLTGQRTLFTLTLLFFLAKAILMVLLPLTGDEAYLINLGLSPRFAYYDHPQLHPWVVYLFSLVSESYIWFRLLGTAMVVAVGYALYRSGRLLGFAQEPSALAALVYVLGASNALSVIFLNDITIVLFLGWGLYFFLRYLKTGTWQDALACGALAGAAFLVKYTVAVVVLPYFITLLLLHRPRLLHFTLYFAAALLPFVALNLYSNYTCCWSNIVFNVFNRAGEARLDNVVESVVTFILVMNPLLLYFFIRGGRALGNAPGLTVGRGSLLLVLLLPFLFLLLISLKKAIYFAWVVNFGFILHLLLFALPPQTLRRAAYVAFGYSLLLFVGLGVLIARVGEVNQVARYQPAITPQAFCEVWNREAPGYMRAATYYDEAAVLSYHCGKTINMFMDNYFGRDDDLAVNHAALDGKDIAILVDLADTGVRSYSIDAMRAFFHHSDVRQFSVGRFEFALLLGQGFDYPKYRDEFLHPMYLKHYRRPLPAWFPEGRCPLRD